VREHDRHVRVAPKRWLPDEALVEHAAEGVDIGPPVDLLTGDLLRRDIVDGAHEGRAVTDGRLLGDPLGHSEVRQVDVVGAVGTRAGVQQHVGRLHVPMHQTATLGRIQGAGDLGEYADRGGRVQAAALEARSQVAPVHVAHGDEQDAPGRPGLVDRDDVGMVERGGQLRLAQEALPERLVLRQPDGQQLQRDPPLEPQILRQVDDAHAAQAQRRLDPVTGQLRPDPRVVAHLHVRVLAFGALQHDKTTRGYL
jgi:hypothetical protein